MKGTLFSADFVKDSNDNLRLLEINTDTTISKNNISLLDYSHLISALSENNITKFIVIHKPDIHKEFVADLSSSLSTDATFITQFTEVKEAATNIYPTAVDDSADTFILRLAYDESALFDSEYAKGTLNTLKLFADFGSGSMVTEFFHSSSVAGEYDNITREFNSNSLPDCTVKSISDNTHSYLSFYKIGSESELDTNDTRWSAFISQTADEDKVIQSYHHDAETISNNRVSSIRSYSIIYGSELSLIQLGQFQQTAAFELPSISLYDESKYVNQIDARHYYEFATNIPKLSSTLDGILSSHKVLKSDGTYSELGDISVGDSLKSYYIQGVDVSSDDDTFSEWSQTGSSLPSGSYLTSSVVIYKNSRELTDKTLTKLTIQNNVDSLYVATNKSFLVYDSGSDITSWKHAMHIDPTSDYLLDYDGSEAEVTANDMIVIQEDGFSLVELDVEDTDTFIISGSTDINSYVVHNAPCFVAGTEILLADGDVKNIENISKGDVVLTYDFKENKSEANNVLNVFSKQVEETVKYSFSNGISLQATVDHPIYVLEKGWASYDDSKSNSLYSLESSVQKIEKGDKIKLIDGEVELIDIEVINESSVVYNLQEVEHNHNYFANGILVHNRKA